MKTIELKGRFSIAKVFVNGELLYRVIRSKGDEDVIKSIIVEVDSDCKFNVLEEVKGE